MTGESMIDYEALAQEAMRNVVRSVLIETAEKGLPGDHHFYISFDTLAPGVILSKRLREKYAEEMTIVLQHRFWDLIINEHRFEVKLTFDGIPERLVVPFKAIKVFFDPSVRYGLQFESVAAAMDQHAASSEGIDDAFDDPFADREFKRPELAPAPVSRDMPVRPVPEISPVEPAEANPAASDGREPEVAEAILDVPEAAEGELPEEEEVGGAEIVSLDAFRKK